jgi:WD40 repeat protein
MSTDLRTLLQDAAGGSWEPLNLDAMVQVARVRTRRRYIAQALAGVAFILIVVFASAGVSRQLGIQKVKTADEPSSEETANAPEQGRSQNTEAGSVRFGRVPGTSSSPRARGAGLAGAELPTASDVIAFNRFNDIYLVNADGSDVRFLLAGAWASWSRDGKRIAFSATECSPSYCSGRRWDDGGEIRHVSADGSGVQENMNVRGFSPTWSPDGELLAFSFECGSDSATSWMCTWIDPRDSADQRSDQAGDCGPECGIGVVPRDGIGRRYIGSGMWPDWGPDGRIIFNDGPPSGPCGYYRNNVGTTGLQCAMPLWTMNPDGSGRTRLPIDAAISPKWSPDGRKIAYFTPTGGVFVADSDGTRIVTVAPLGYRDASWSPDGQWLAVTRFAGDAEDRNVEEDRYLVLRKMDGSAERRLTSGTYDLLPAYAPRR